MNRKVKELMELINKYNYECYIVGGFVRDYLIGSISLDYDLCTNASNEILVDILKDYNIISVNFTTVSLCIDDLVVEITTYRKELEYYKRKPIKYELVNNLSEDLIRRDFTINTICMDSNMNIIDLLNGKTDIENKVIKSVGNSNLKLKEDPLRILRALRFSSVLNFKIDKELSMAIENNKYLLKELSKEKIKLEIDKILRDGDIKILKLFDIDSILELDVDNFKYYDNILLNWFQLDKYNQYILSKKDKKIIKNIKELYSLGITKYNIYKYGLDISLLVGLLLNVNVYDIYNNLKIKSRSDIDIKVDDIKLFTNKINMVYEELEYLIINEKLDNKYDVIMSYLNNKEHTI